MPDWQEIVRRQLADLPLDPDDRSEVIAELASHLEELYEQARRKGMEEEKASQFVLAQVTDWKDLQQKIQNARQEENTMNSRITRFWLPSLLTLTIAMSIPMLLAMMGLDTMRLLRLSGAEQRNYSLTVYAIWMLGLPLVGALGAYLSRRAGGTDRAMALSAVFPALAMALVILLVIPASMVFEPGFKAVRLLGIPGLLVVFSFIPGACLLAGVLLQRVFKRKQEILPAR